MRCTSLADASVQSLVRKGGLGECGQGTLRWNAWRKQKAIGGSGVGISCVARDETRFVTRDSCRVAFNGKRWPHFFEH